MVDAAVDINSHIISASDFETSDDYHSTLTTLAEHNILPRELADRIAPSVGLRNRIVHQYEEVNPTRMIEETKQKSHGGTRICVRLAPVLHLTNVQLPMLNIENLTLSL